MFINKHIKTIHLIFIIVIILIFPAIIFLNKIESFANFIWANQPFHTFLESIGALFSIIIAIVISLRDQDISKNKDGLLVLGFISMGILNAFHSVLPPGVAFVFLHSIAALFGGFFFVLIIFPKVEKIRIAANQIIWLTVFLVLIGIVALVFPNILPAMVYNNKFTNTAFVINLIAGFLFLIASIRLFIDFLKTPHNEIFLFAVLSLLFSISGFTFNQSSLWDSGWWIWHVLQLSAFIVAFIIIAQQYLSDIKRIMHTKNQLKDANEQLEANNQQLQATEQQLRASNQLLEANEKRLKESNAELQQFAYVASHDLKEPLRMVSSYTQLLERKYKDKLDEKGHKFINYAVDGANRMQVLIDDLLDYSRVTSQAGEFMKNDPNIMLENVLFGLGKSIDESGVKITYDNLPEVYADKSQMERVFQNLISNAIKFRKKDQKSIIHISAKKEKNNWLFSIKDNGIGINEDFQKKVFIIFQRLHSKDAYEGTGIGLAVTKRIILRHNGKLWFESELGKGTTFYFTLPIKKRSK